VKKSQNIRTGGISTGDQDKNNQNIENSSLKTLTTFRPIKSNQFDR